MSESGMLVSEETLKRFAESTQFVESRKSSILSGERQIGQLSPNSATHLRGWLLQDVWHGESARVAVAQSAPQLSSFKIDQFGIWDRVSFPFQIRLRVASRGAGVSASTSTSPLPLPAPPTLPSPLTHGSLLWNSPQLSNPTSSQLRAAFNQGAFVNSTLPSLGKIQVSAGNPGSDAVVINSLYPSGPGLNPTPFTLGNPNSLPPISASVATGYNHGFWLISIQYPIPLDMDLITTGNIITDVRLLSVTKTSDMDSLNRVIATDTLDLDRPLARGSKVIMTHFSDLGWGIVSAMGKQFIEVTDSQ